MICFYKSTASLEDWSNSKPKTACKNHQVLLTTEAARVCDDVNQGRSPLGYFCFLGFPRFFKIGVILHYSSTEENNLGWGNSSVDTALAAQFENWSSYPQNPSKMGQGVHSQSTCEAQTGWVDKLESSRLRQKLYLSKKVKNDWGRHQHQTMSSILTCTHT